MGMTLLQKNQASAKGRGLPMLEKQQTELRGAAVYRQRPTSLRRAGVESVDQDSYRVYAPEQGMVASVVAKIRSACSSSSR